jgi:glutamate--cysteine ligase catalytic subunit
MRASGELMTLATWIRTQVRSHPDYKKDSKVTDRMGYDLVKKMHKISKGELQCSELLPSYNTRSKENIPRAIEKAQKITPEKRV